MKEGTAFGVHPRDTGPWHLQLGNEASLQATPPLAAEPQPGPGPGSHLPTEALAGIGDGLGGHERRGAGRAGQLGVVPLKLVADAEVGDLHVPVVPQEQIGRLDVPVDDLLAVHCGERQLERRPGPRPRPWPKPAPQPGKPV